MNCQHLEVVGMNKALRSRSGSGTDRMLQRAMSDAMKAHPAICRLTTPHTSESYLFHARLVSWVQELERTVSPIKLMARWG